MKTLITNFRQMLWLAIFSGIAFGEATAFAQAKDNIRIVALLGERTVEILPHGSTTWVLTQTNQTLNSFDRVRTGKSSSVVIRWSDQSVLRFDALTELEILPPEAVQDDHGLNFVRGMLYFFHRGPPGRIRVITSGALAGIKGTEFAMSVLPVRGVEQTTLSVIDGKVSFENAAGNLQLTNQQQAVAEPGRKPMPTPGFIANNILQWCFYYPGVLDANDLPLATFEKNIFYESLVDYRAGDLLGALAKHPGITSASSAAEIIYHATVLLNGGQISAAEAELSQLNLPQASENTQRLANALRTLIAAVKHETFAITASPQLATEFLAASYYAQSQAGPKSLEHALQFARQAVEKSPEFGFGWERVAELEFSFGRTEQAMAALDHALRFSPRNAEALSLKGFLLAAQNKTLEAIGQFDRALALDAALGNAWLGRGLCQIRRGDLNAGRENLLIAAAMEPQRATLRSYLGKAFGEASDPAHALHELNLAKQLDPGDPTAWLYSALLHEQNNQVNEAIRDLEKSQELNNNRSVYRSSLLLDQDRAVRSANLARIYAEAGLDDVALREASRAVNADYENFSAHLFLANSYDILRQGNQSNLRYEPAAISEYLIGNLLSPPGAGVFSSTLSQQEYSRLFENNHLGLNVTTEYLSRGAWTQNEVFNLVSDRTSIALESDYSTDPGQQGNNDSEQRTYSFQIKQQISPKDSLYGQVFYSDTWTGDVAQHYDPATAILDLRTHDEQHPNVIVGYHHEWTPEIQTLALVGYLNDTFRYDGPVSMPVREFDEGTNYDAIQVSASASYQGRLNVFPVELQQIWKTDRGTTIFGGRFQTGDFRVSNSLTNFTSGAFFPAPGFNPPPSQFQFERFSLYGYQQLNLGGHLNLFAGLAYDYLRLPKNFLSPPISTQDQRVGQLSPKVGFIWHADGTVFRGAYTRSIVGASIDQSFELEPSQLAGFTQIYRGIIPDSVKGTASGSGVSSYALSLEHKFRTETYLGLSATLLQTDYTQTDGGLSNILVTPFIDSDRERLQFREKSLVADLNQLLGNKFSAGLQYRLTAADLKSSFVNFPPTLPVSGFDQNAHNSSCLQQLMFHANVNLPSGFFGQFQAAWIHQNNDGFDTPEPASSFWQLNAFVGYRFPRHRAELSIGLLNITDQDYRLEPLTLHPDYPRQRTFTFKVQFNF